MKNAIEVGDIVAVNMNAAQITISHTAEVKHMPSGPGESWIFQDTKTNQLFYTNEPITVTLIKKREPKVMPFNILYTYMPGTMCVYDGKKWQYLPEDPYPGASLGIQPSTENGWKIITP